MLSNTMNKWLETFTGPEFWETILNSVIKIIVILIVAFIIIRIGNRLIDKIFKSRRRSPIKMNEKREQTIKILLKSTLTYTVYFIMIVMILESINIRISALLAGAGIAGLAIGFGAQSLVKDVISGFFIIFERQFSVDDYVEISGVEGTVEEIGLRTTKVISWTGEENVIPNGNITQVINYSVNNGTSVVDLKLSYETNILEVEKELEEILKMIPEKYDIFINVPEIQGIRELDVSNYLLRVIAETEPAAQWQGERYIRKEIQNELFKRGIDIPMQHFIVHSIKKEDDFHVEYREKGNDAR
ncbi:MAG TPA: mechanosensitive ion channel family protein [Pseudogracilibacillus sp.]|nr:mechanosensitive ion channel family protein [Pseudogracilibacillus sp.]